MKRFLVDTYKNLAGFSEYAFRKLTYPKNELIVLCMHSTPDDRLQHFSSLVDFICKHFKPLSPAQLDDYYNQHLTDGPYVLFTFDDGLKNNLKAAQVLSSKHISALFFLVPAFISSTSQKEFYMRNIRPAIDESVDRLEEDFTAMSYENLKLLKRDGHYFGAHSMTHTLHNEMLGDDLRIEIANCKTVLEQNIGCEIDSFCSINNTSLSINAAGKKVIDENYRFHFTTFPGLNSSEKNRHLILRRNIEVHWSLGKIKFALGQADLGRWKAEIHRFRQLH